MKYVINLVIFVYYYSNHRGVDIYSELIVSIF